MKKGLFLVFEGPDGSGKSTQINLLKEYLEENNIDCLITREPGGTKTGEAIRSVLLNPVFSEMSDKTEMLLYAASRAQIMEEVIVPALDEGKVVICDRFVDSSLVYQGIARGLGVNNVSLVNNFVIGTHYPDLVFFIDIPEEEGMRRKREQKKLDRLEQETINFHKKVSEGYRDILSGRHDVYEIDGTLSIDVIQKTIREKAKELLERE